MDKEILEDFRLKVKDRLTEYLKKSNLPLDNSSPIRPTTICPCCGKKAEIITYPVDPPTINWRCTVCMEIGDAIRFAKEYYRMNTDEQAIVDICRKLGIQITTLSTFTAEELIRMDFSPLQELIEGMLAPGLYILAGASKIGKSWLVLQIAHHISTGLPLWDRKTVKGDVLYLSLEDTLRRIQSRLLRICDGETGNITFATEAELIGNGFEKQIHNYMRHNPKTKLSEFMVKQIKDSVADVDVAVLVTEPLGKIHQTELDLLQRFRDLRLPAILAINKIDTVAKKDLMMEKIAAFSQLFDFEAVVPVSAMTGDGAEELLEEIGEYAAEGPHYFPDDAMTDQPERVIVAEIIREKLLNNLSDEIPHGTAVTVEQMIEREDKNIIDIHAVIYCEKDSHKGIIIGKQGAMLKKVASQARREIESFLDIKINLQCWVKVKEDWRNRIGVIRDLGFQDN